MEKNYVTNYLAQQSLASQIRLVELRIAWIEYLIEQLAKELGGI
jgi:hypothetical protein